MSRESLNFATDSSDSYTSLLEQLAITDHDVQQLIRLRNTSIGSGHEQEEKEEDSDEIQHQQSLLDVAAPLAASPSTILLEGAPPQFSHRIFFGLIPNWILIISLLLFVTVTQQFADTLAENAQRIQEMKFFTDGLDCDHIDPVPPTCINGMAQQETVNNWNQALTTILGFAITPVFGALSDIKGRRPVLIFGMLLDFLMHLMYTLRWLAPHTFTYYYVVIAQILLNSINITVTEAIISDVVPAKSRSMWIGVSLAFIEIAEMILPQVSQYLGADIAFPAAISLATITVIGSCFVPETLTEKHKPYTRFSWSSLSPIRAFSVLLRYRIVTILGLAIFISGFLQSAGSVLLDAPVGILFPTSPSFQANSVSITAALNIFVLTVGQYILLRFFSQRVVMLIGGSGLILGIIGTATLTSINQIYGWMVPFSLIVVLTPVMLQILSNYVPQQEYGTAMAAIQTLEGFGQAIAAQFVLPLYFWWSPAPGSVGPSAGGSMHFFPQLLFSMIGIILCVLLWNMHDPTQGEKDDYARVKREEKLQERDASARERNESEMLGVLDLNQSSSSINRTSTAIRIADPSSLLDSEQY